MLKTTQLERPMRCEALAQVNLFFNLHNDTYNYVYIIMRKVESH